MTRVFPFTISSQYTSTEYMSTVYSPTIVKYLPLTRHVHVYGIDSAVTAVLLRGLTIDRADFRGFDC